ncbi:DNA-packaging protein [Hansschlegelia zhihuaiae]|uniref:ATP-binding protein n=1 Tax=Hansschlegelia zhihuaiae TaxID=405005 RepID=A0A4Q0MP74_9HYPH|nr:terminase family protein [Hansschlegelia zhihuaiae]RXF75463.1 ATP-binding protein [Hansschlegelia zhihuaiae]
MRLRDALIACAKSTKRDAILAGLRPRDVAWVAGEWEQWAREDQKPPAGDWTTWLALGGRGAGKTRAGAEWVRGLALGHPGFGPLTTGRIALVGETYADLREVMIDGPSGLRAVHAGGERPKWEATRKRLLWPNGVVALGFSAEDPEALRGPQFEAAWSDEIAKWRQGEEAWDMLQFGLRLGSRPRQVATTTPRAVPLIKRLMADAGVVVTRAATRANAAHLAPGFLQAVVGTYAGTRLGRQELEGELIEDREDALWSRDAIEGARVRAAPELTRIVVAVDPPAGGSRRSDACGLVAVGLGTDGRAYVIADETLHASRPELWAARAVALWRRLGADALVAEVNQGGEMVRSVIAGVDPGVPVVAVRATRGKWLRAEPVAALYAQGRVLHVGPHPALEDEMAGFGLDGLSNGRSPDRVDALVWAVTHLMLGAKGRGPRVLAL